MTTYFINVLRTKKIEDSKFYIYFYALEKISIVKQKK